MTDFLYIDSETFSPEPLKNGTYRYVEHPEFEVLMLAYALNDAPVDVWDITAGGGMPMDLELALDDERVIIVAHDAKFDRVALGKAGLIAAPLERWWCTSAQARAHSLPGGLDKLCGIFNLEDADSKMPGGKNLINLFCKPQKATKKNPAARATRDTHPEKWAEFIEYCAVDVVAMREVHKRLPKWNYGGKGHDGRKMWHFEQRANDRGFAVDVQLAQGAVSTVKRVKGELDGRTQELTGYDPETGEGVEKATQRDKLLEHLLAEFGVSLPDMKAATIERRLEDENLPDEVKELLAIRLQSSTASVAKYKTLLRCVTQDERLHGTMLYCGAQRTGRRSGRMFQPQNLSRVPKYFPGSKVKAKDEYDIIAEMIRNDCLDLLVRDPMETMGYMVRAALVAAPGKKLNVADLSNIEGRMMAFGAGETWKLKAFAEYDLDPTNMAKDLYILSYARSFGVPVEAVVRDAEEGGILRQIGKVQELALQYWGGWRAFEKMAAIYGVELPRERIKEVVAGWREANRATMDFSGELEKAARKAITHPGVAYPVRSGMAVFRRDGAWLRMRLPSGRCLCYPHPEVDADGNISYMGINAYSRKWERIGTYGGKLGENWTQAASADYMMENEVEFIEPAGYDIVLDVHDEVVTETDDTEEFSGKGLAKLLSTPRPWSVGMPCVSKGYSTKRYRKD